jgi:tetratricopeptide (TPR) repeat protein
MAIPCTTQSTIQKKDRLGGGVLTAFLLFAISLLSYSPSFAGLPVSLQEGGGIYQDILNVTKLNTLKKSRKIERSGSIVSTLIQMAEVAEGKGDRSAAISYAERAVQFDPQSALPHFFLSQTYGLGNQEDILRSLNEYIAALRLAVDDFSFLSSSVGLAGVILFFAVTLSILTFILYAFTHHFSQWVHCVHERIPDYLSGNTISLILVFFLFLLLFLFPPFWVFLISLFLFVFLGRPKEKLAAIYCLVGLFLSTLLLTPFSLLLSGQQSPFLSQMVRNQQGDFSWSDPLFGKGSSPDNDWRVPFMKASYHLQEKDFDTAEYLYQEALLKNQNGAMILNNLGNIYFYRNDFKKALSFYQKAIDQSPDYLVAIYNMSQTHNEMLSFEEGKKKFLEGKAIDSHRMNGYSQSVIKYPNYPVIEGRFSQKDLWKEVLLLNRVPGVERKNLFWRVWVGDISYFTFLLLSLLAGAVSARLSRVLSLYVMDGGVCPFCLKVICDRCQKSFSTYKICMECGKDMKTVIGKRVGRKSKKGYPFYLLPGGAQLASNAPVFGLSLLVPFYFIVMLFTVGNRFLSSSYWHLSVEKTPLFFVVVTVLYGVSMSTLLLGRNR